jgi:hypothetical protein
VRRDGDRRGEEWRSHTPGDLATDLRVQVVAERDILSLVDEHKAYVGNFPPAETFWPSLLTLRGTRPRGSERGSGWIAIVGALTVE